MIVGSGLFSFRKRLLDDRGVEDRSPNSFEITGDPSEEKLFICEMAFDFSDLAGLSTGRVCARGIGLGPRDKSSVPRICAALEGWDVG